MKYIKIFEEFVFKFNKDEKIKSIKNFTDANVIASEKTYEYVLKDQPDKSSGNTIDVPKYNYNYLIYHPTQNSHGGFFSLDTKYGPLTLFCQYFVNRYLIV